MAKKKSTKKKPLRRDRFVVGHCRPKSCIHGKDAPDGIYDWTWPLTAIEVGEMLAEHGVTGARVYELVPVED